MVRRINKISQIVKLNLNASIFKKYIMNYIISNNITYEKIIKDSEINVDITTKEIEQQKKLISPGQSFITITSLIEYLLKELIDKSLVNANKSTVGLYNLSSDDIMKNIIIDKYLYNIYYKYTSNYNSNINYINVISQYNFINEYIDAVYPKALFIDNGGINLISYIIISILNDVLNAMNCIITYSKKSYFNSKMVITACSILFKNPIKDILNIKLLETDNIFQEFKEEEKKKNLVETEKINDNEEEKNNFNNENIITKS